jgi:Hydrolase of X-linked nucleoside diphosphate N terminal
MTSEPKWLTWARERGLTYGRDPFDCERYEMLRALASTIMANHTSASAERLEVRTKPATQLRRSMSVQQSSTAATR